MFVIKSNLQLCGIANFVGIILLSRSQLDIFNASSAKKLQLNRSPQTFTSWLQYQHLPSTRHLGLLLLFKHLIRFC